MSSIPERSGQGAHCSTCAMRHLCMPEGLCTDDTAKLQAVIATARTIRRGESLFHIGDTFESLYAIRSGSIKTTVSHANGREQVTGLHLSGDALGLDGIGENRHACNAVALEDSSVCVFPFMRFERACRETSALQRRLHQLMSRQIVRESKQMMTLGTLRAEERVAAFLLDMSARLLRRGLCRGRIHAAPDAGRHGQLSRHDARNGQPHAVAVPVQRSDRCARQADPHP